MSTRTEPFVPQTGLDGEDEGASTPPPRTNRWQDMKANSAAAAAANPDDVMAGIYRDQWNDYVTRFFPLEDELVATYNNPEVHKRILGEAMAKAEAGFDVARGSYGRTMAKYGINPDTQTQQETDRAFGLNRTLSLVDTRNRTRQGLIERDAGMLAGGVSTGGLKKEGE